MSKRQSTGSAVTATESKARSHRPVSGRMMTPGVFDALR